MHASKILLKDVDASLTWEIHILQFLCKEDQIAREIPDCQYIMFPML